MNKKILHLNFSDNGGAAVAVIRIHECLKDSNIDSKILVAEKTTSNNDIICNQNKISRILWNQKKKISRNLKFIYKTKNKNTHSVAIFNSNIREQIINYNPDLLILHWLGNELISLKDLDSLKIPKVWVLHDMWPYCGAEHYTTSERFIEGYNPTNRPDYEKGFDLNKWVFERKKKYLDKNIKIIATSNWQLDNSKKSFLLKQNKILKIPLPINTNFWKPFNKLEARKILGWEKDKTYFLFGFSDISKRFIKGLDITLKLFQNFNLVNKRSKLNIFGHLLNFREKYENVNFLGRTESDEELKLIYAASDILLAPSRQESFGQICLEALSCGLPIVCLKKTGPEDFLINDKMGISLDMNEDLYSKDVINKIQNLLNVSDKNEISKNIKKTYSYKVIADGLIKIFN